jgi:hypothetical protein
MSRLKDALLPMAWFLAIGLVPPPVRSAEAQIVNSPPSAKDWDQLAKLPDWSGVWTPDVGDQRARVQSDPPPWKPEVLSQVAAMNAEEAAGHPRSLFANCLPEGMPSWMLITHNGLEFLFTPGRLTILGETDGNRLRRIYTDGRSHPEDPDPTFHGHSIGHWEGDTLVVDTVAVLPEAYVAVSEEVGVPNNGDLHVIERLHLAGADTLQDDLEIIAPHILTKPWHTSRIYFRQRARKFDIVEGECLQGGFSEQVDKLGNSVLVPVPLENGLPIPSDKH